MIANPESIRIQNEYGLLSTLWYWLQKQFRRPNQMPRWAEKEIAKKADLNTYWQVVGPDNTIIKKTAVGYYYNNLLYVKVNGKWQPKE